MSKATIGFGLALGLLGAIGFVLTGSTHPTALIPLWFGCALLTCGGLAMTENAKRRMLWMHIAVTLGLVGFLFPGTMAVIAYVTAHGRTLARPGATGEQAIMSLVCLIFVMMCIRSFIAARRERNAQQPSVN